MKKFNFYIVAGIITGLVGVFCIALIYTEGATYQHIAYAVMSLIFSLMTIIWKKKGYSIGLILAGTVFSYTMPMSNILPFFFFAVLMLEHAAWRYHILFYYFINLFIECALLEENILVHYPEVGTGSIHLAIHILLTLFFFVSITHFIQLRFVRKELELTDDEIIILEELKKERMLKNCKSFSKNTLTDKMKDARSRNHIESTMELLAQYELQDQSQL